MKYRNVLTGTVLETPCTVAGEHWVPLPEGDAVARKRIQASAEQKPAVKKAAGKKPASKR